MGSLLGKMRDCPFRVDACDIFYRLLAVCRSM
jgi:hypothetical protein